MCVSLSYSSGGEQEMQEGKSRGSGKLNQGVDGILHQKRESNRSTEEDLDSEYTALGLTNGEVDRREGESSRVTTDC